MRVVLCGKDVLPNLNRLRQQNDCVVALRFGLHITARMRQKSFEPEKQAATLEL